MKVRLLDQKDKPVATLEAIPERKLGWEAIVFNGKVYVSTIQSPGVEYANGKPIMPFFREMNAAYIVS